MSSVELVTPLSKLPNFDPRKVPLVGTDAHLPAVAVSSLDPASLRQRFATPPVWYPELVMEPKFAHRAATPAAVLIPIVVRQRLTVLLTQRTAHLSSHSGQIAFPGGKRDTGDENLLVTALREAREEVGLQAKHVQILGTLPVYSTGSGFLITPVVALLDGGFSVVRNPEEVDEIFEVPLDFLMDPANHWRQSLEWEGLRREWMSMPYQDGATERFIWGATAGMLRNLYRFLSA